MGLDAIHGMPVRPLMTMAQNANTRVKTTCLRPPVLLVSLCVFGDSLSDSGNNRIVLGVSGAGQTITSNACIPSLPYPSGTYRNGSVWGNSSMRHSRLACRVTQAV